MTRIRWVVAIVASVVLALSIVLAVSLGNDQTAVKSELLGKPAPSFSLVSFEGDTINLAALRGKVVVINFWNDWCEPCIAETPDLIRLHNEYRDDPEVAMLGIVHDERKKADVISYRDAVGLEYPSMFDPDVLVASDYGVTGQPETFVIDRVGIVRAFVAGPVDAQQIVNVIDRLKA